MNKVGIYLIIGVIAIIAGWIFFLGDDTAEYETEVKSWRADRETFLRTSSESPFTQFKTPFKKIDWYPVHHSYRMHARVEPIETAQYYEVAKSDGTTERYLRYAWLHFKLHGRPHKLLVLKRPFGPGYFLAFADDTAGKTTYGGGRYIDLPEIKGDRVTLDFNKATNPYCAYVPEFSCPLPPRENIMKTLVEAGEMDYNK